MNTRTFLAAAFTFTATLCTSQAENAADLQPTIAKAGKIMVEDTFASAALGKSWSAAKGDWQPHDGVLVGKEKKEDKHPAVLMLGQPNRDSIIRFAFKLDGSKSFALSLNSAKGHLFRVSIGADSVTMNKDKDKKDPNSKALELGKAAVKLADGKWHTLLLEMSGAKVAAQIDNGVKISASNPELDVDKTGYRFVTAGESVQVDDVKVWAVAK